ncbi:DNA polymerase III subunit chi [Acidithiobacillus caldus]|uniref:DNA polymerase III subunit chi n=1 Tax=Acidithiobacillus caldus TaxID=33059 RepID=UPI001C069E95|nr:DNA polymerase III subunit chi [Acidithiobacillus caldus]MBU2790703.1 DNA polymerase III subunit chi [Acidithiobacillus caldus]MBU2819992.1 DNA polymerase III subunit chi [Acidithiobacillus caldus]
MPSASFYRLPANLLTATEQHRAVCRVVAKAWQVLGQVNILCRDEELAESMDDLLWTYQAGAFTPHGRDPQEPVCLYAGTDASVLRPAPALALVGLRELPGNLPEAARLLDFIPPDESGVADARQRYRILREAGYTIQTYTLEA